MLADRVECAEILLKAGCKVDKKDETGRTALLWAAHKVTQLFLIGNCENSAIFFLFSSSRLRLRF